MLEINDVVLYCIVLYCIVLYCIVMHCVALRCVALRCVALRCVALRCVALRCVALRCIVLYCIVLYCIVTSLMCPLKRPLRYEGYLCNQIQQKNVCVTSKRTMLSNVLTAKAILRALLSS